MSRKLRKSFVGHPSAILFLRISGEGVFNSHRRFHCGQTVLSDAFTLVRLIFYFRGTRDCLTPEPPALDPISERRATTQTGQCLKCLYWTTAPGRHICHPRYPYKGTNFSRSQTERSRPGPTHAL